METLGRLPGYSGSSARVSTGVKHLDEVTQGGFLAGKAYLLSGMPGTGKSIFALQFLLAGLADGRNGVYVCVNETPEDLMATASSLGWDVEAAVAAGHIHFLDMSPFFSGFNVRSSNRQDRRATDVNIRKFLVELGKHVREGAAKCLVIDSINAILPGPVESHDGTLARELGLSLEQYIVGCTNLLTFDCWEGSGLSKVHPVESYVSGVINLSVSRSSGSFDRGMYVKKMRATAAVPAIYKFVIKSPEGISLVRKPGKHDARIADQQFEVAEGQSAVLLKD